MLKTFFKFVIPSICAMVIFNLYTLVDGIFVAHFVGDTALASINIASPYITTIFSVGVLFAVGSSTVMSIYRGKKNVEKTDKIFSMNILTVSIIALIISILSFVFSKQLTTFLGANKDVFNDSNTYIKTLSCFAFFYIVSYCFEVLLKADGFPHKSIIGVCIGAATNMILDPIFMGIFHMQIFGAALATGLSQLFTFSFFFYHFAFGHISHFHFVKGSYPWQEYKRILPLGLADCVSEISPGIMVTVFNYRINELLSTQGLVTFTILMYIYNLVLMIMAGTSQGCLPLMSYYHGKKDMHSVETIHSYARILILIVSIVVFGIVECFAPWICLAFNEQNVQSISALRQFSFVFLIMGQVVITSCFLTTIEKPKYAFTLSICRGIIMVILSLFVCTSILGSSGIWISCFISECICLIFAIWAIIKVKR